MKLPLLLCLPTVAKQSRNLLRVKNNVIYSRGGGTCLAEGKHAGVVPGTFKLAARISPQSSELSPQKQPPNDVAQVALVCRRHLSPQVGSGRVSALANVAAVTEGCFHPGDYPESLKSRSRCALHVVNTLISRGTFGWASRVPWEGQDLV